MLDHGPITIFRRQKPVVSSRPHTGHAVVEGSAMINNRDERHELVIRGTVRQASLLLFFSFFSSLRKMTICEAVRKTSSQIAQQRGFWTAHKHLRSVFLTRFQLDTPEKASTPPKGSNFSAPLSLLHHYASATLRSEARLCGRREAVFASGAVQYHTRRLRIRPAPT